MMIPRTAAPEAAVDRVKSEVVLKLNEGMEDKGVAVGVCAMMAMAYVALLYAPALFLPNPKSIREHMLRRFFFAAVASALAPFVCFVLLPIQESRPGKYGPSKYLVRLMISSADCSNNQRLLKRENQLLWSAETQTPSFLRTGARLHKVRPHWESDGSAVLEVFGLRTHHLWQAIVLPTLLTAVLYLGPLMLAFYEFIEWCYDASQEASGLLREISSAVVMNGKNMASDILVWRNCLVAPVSEELVFRACMVPLLLCGGFSTSATVFLCPMFFALAHLHHFWELIYHQKRGRSTAALIVGMQLGYTTVFGWYATFLYLRTGHLIAPIVAHIFCNTMGLPNIEEALTSSHRKVVGVAYGVGLVGFFLLLGPMSNPGLFNKGSAVKGCDCWAGFCKWTVSQM